MDTVAVTLNHGYLEGTQPFPKWGCDGDVAQLIECRTGMPLRQIQFPGAAGDFSPRVSYGVRAPPCATACINVSANVNHPVVHGRVLWIMATLKRPACTLGWEV